MNQNWEQKFEYWAGSPSKTETQRSENAFNALKNAIEASAKLRHRNVGVFLQGSYRNRTNTRGESDVDIGVVCYATFFGDYPEGTDRSTFGNSPATYHYPQFKDEVGEALVAHFGSGAVRRGNKAFDVRETSYHLEADVAPFFEHRRYTRDGRYESGVELQPDKGGRVINWPEQHYENGNAKNDRTRRRYRALVRILKNLRNEMDENSRAAAKPIVGFLVECLVWNTADNVFGHSTYGEDLKAVLTYLYNHTKTDDPCNEWGEVSELKYLFRGPQKWTRQQAHDFVLDAWRYVAFS